MFCRTEYVSSLEISSIMLKVLCTPCSGASWGMTGECAGEMGARARQLLGCIVCSSSDHFLCAKPLCSRASASSFWKKHTALFPTPSRAQAQHVSHEGAFPPQLIHTSLLDFVLQLQYHSACLCSVSVHGSYGASLSV